MKMDENRSFAEISDGSAAIGIPDSGEMIETYDNLWLDTTMVIRDYFPLEEAIDLPLV